MTRTAASVRQEIVREVADRSDDRPEARAALADAALRRLHEADVDDAHRPALYTRLDRIFEHLDAPDGEARVEVRSPAEPIADGPPPGAVLLIACRDRRFLHGTVQAELEARDLQPLRELRLILGVRRDDDGRLREIEPARGAADRAWVLHLELADRLSADDAEDLAEAVRERLADARTVTDDYERMVGRLREIAADLETQPDGDDPADAPQEVAALLHWALDDHLVLLGLRDYRVEGEHVAVEAGSGLGLLADETRSRMHEPVPLAELSEAARERLTSGQRLVASRTRWRSPVQRREPMEELVLLRHRNGAIEVTRLVGLFTEKGEAAPAASTPVLRRRLRSVLEIEDVVPGSHDELTLVSLFEALPKDELLRADLGDLQATLVDLLHSDEHRELRTLVRPDPELSTVSVLVHVPGDTWSPRLRHALQELLKERFGADRLGVDLSLGERHGAVARFLLHVPGEIPRVSAQRLQAEVRRLTRPWLDAVRDALLERSGVAEGERLTELLAARLPQSYRETVPPEVAAEDVALLDRLRLSERALLAELQGRGEQGLVRLKVGKRGRPLVLSGFLPILESLGLEVVEEVPHHLTGGELTLHDFGLRVMGAGEAAVGAEVERAVHAAWDGHLDVDSINRLVVYAGLSWRDVSILRAYRRYRRQVGAAHTPEYVNEVLVAEQEATRALVDHLHARLDPEHDGDDEEATRQRVLDACGQVRHLDHDRILRGMLALVDATLRTNAFRDDAVADHSGVPYLSFKLDPALVPDMPSPAPHREIFVTSPEVEGVHLRAGAVARGGLRWSDRRDDVRSEVLDLVKAQTRKNGLIVPTGAKGGFVLRKEPDEPDALREAVKANYVTFVRGMLDLTDDREQGEVVGPPQVVRHDGDDPYLVVAADRGTAALSDTANALAARYGFWLDDAFASGGSNGYDHKAHGVTANGAWVVIRRHFRELDVDVTREPVSVAGVGDMSGDVFGNGLLRYPTLRLVAAFDHRHVFLDPDPDLEAAYAERKRLFELPRSSWADYDPSLISEGGGVFSREQKSIALTPQIKELLRVDDDELSPPALIRAVLCAPVDLLYAGGIGTYVKASTQRNDEIADRSTDEVRVDADQLRARVVGEGANLFITQPARIQYARRGGRIDQDAIHNAGGVSTSDHEVNVKILLNLAVEDGRIDRDQRIATLAEVGDAVVERVMGDVDRQAACLSREAARQGEGGDDYLRLLERLDDRDEFDREVEVLPEQDELADRLTSGAALTRPELSTLLAWAKRDCKDALLDSDVVDLPLARERLPGYFPDVLVERYGDLVDRHPLRRELVATVLTNDLVDRMGVGFAAAMAAEHGVAPSRVALAWEVARQGLGADAWLASLDELDGAHDPQRVLELDESLRRLLTEVTGTLLSDAGLDDPQALLSSLRPVSDELAEQLLSLGTVDQARARIAHARWLVDDLVPTDLARVVASATDLVIVPDVAALVARRGCDVLDTADVLLRLGDELGIDRLSRLLERCEAPDAWARRQQRGLSADLRRLRREAADHALALEGTGPEARVAAFIEARGDACARASQLIDEIAHADGPSTDAAAVATRAVADAIHR